MAWPLDFGCQFHFEMASDAFAKQMKSKDAFACEAMGFWVACHGSSHVW